MHESLAQEVKPFGIKVTLVEPGAYVTDFGKSGEIADALEPYADFRMGSVEDVSNAAMGEPRIMKAPWIEQLVHGTADRA